MFAFLITAGVIVVALVIYCFTTQYAVASACAKRVLPTVQYVPNVQQVQNVPHVPHIKVKARKRRAK